MTLFLVAVAMLVAPSVELHEPERPAIPPPLQESLAFGASMGERRISVLTWPADATIRRLRVLDLEPESQEIGKLSGYQVTAEQRLSSIQVIQAAAILLDSHNYWVAIRKPQRPSQFGRGAGTLCGGFRPAFAISFTDVAEDTVHAFVCLTCDEIQIDLALAREPRDFRPDPPKPLATPDKGVVRFGLTPAGREALLRLALNAFPNDMLLKKLPLRRK
jgi:hypothetical protein